MKAGRVLLLSLEKKRHWGELIAAFQGLISAVRKLEMDFLPGHV